MRGVNKVILIGNAARDAELRHTHNGKAVSSIRLATNRTVKGEEETRFHTIVCWDRLAETTGTYVKKGDPLYVEGRPQYRSFQDEEGKERGVAEIIADTVQFLSRRDNGSRGEAEAYLFQPAPAPALSAHHAPAPPPTSSEIWTQAPSVSVSAAIVAMSDLHDPDAPRAPNGPKRGPRPG